MTKKIFNSIILTSAISIIITLIFSEVFTNDDIISKAEIFIIAIIVSILLGMMLSRKITRPFIEVNPDDPKINYSEVNPLINKIHIQKSKISRQKNQVHNGKQQLNLITENSPCMLKTPDGDREVIASPSNTTDTVNGIVVFIFDVTEKQQLETLRREFTSNVSHELKTPLTTIYGIADMLTNGIVKPDDIGTFSRSICNEAERLIILINDIVSLSKLDENSISNEDTETDLYKLTEEVFTRLKHSSSEKNIEMTLSGEHIKIIGNRTILDEIIYNLCDNAIKYNKISGSVQVKLSHDSNKIIITVADTGIGIPPEHINRVFERFYRVDKSHSKQINGTGLGLSIVKHGVIYHNGTICVESNVGKGTVFTVEFPIDNKK